MAKRFGRNQRRKMREHIEQQRRSFLEMHGELMRVRKHCAALDRRLNEWAGDVARLMGSDSAFNEQVRRMAVEDINGYGGVLQLMPQISLSAPVAHGGMPMMVTYETVIRALIWRLHMSRDEFSGVVRIELENRYGEPVGYALHPEHRWTEKDAEYLARRIAREMVAHMGRGRASMYGWGE
jgi:hypothetical protein